MCATSLLMVAHPVVKSDSGVMRHTCQVGIYLLVAKTCQVQCLEELKNGDEYGELIEICPKARRDWSG